MNKILIPLICVLLLSSCCNCKQTTKEDKEAMKDNEQLTSQDSQLAHMSPYTRIFLKKMDEEKKFFPENAKFLPSDELIEQFNIIRIEGIYYVGGILQVKENIDGKSIEELGVKIGTKAGIVWTVKIPIGKVEDVLRLDDILYMQIDERIYKPD